MVTANKFFADNQLDFVIADGDYTTAALVDDSIKDCRGAGGYAVLVGGVNLTGTGPTDLVIVAGEDAAITTAYTIGTYSGTVPTAEGGYIVFEVTADQISKVGATNSKDLRYVGAKLTMDNAGDEAVLIPIVVDPQFAYDGLTASSAT